MKTGTSIHAAGNALGIFSIVFWSSVVAFSRSLEEQLGVVSGVTYTYMASGALGMLYFLVKPAALKQVFALPKRYLFTCGSLLASYTLCFYLAVGLSSGRQQVIEIGIINYLWPSFTLLFSIPILKKRAQWPLVPGIVLALAGIALLSLEWGTWTITAFIAGFRSNPVPYVLSFVAAILWGLYSNLSKRLAGDASGSAMPFFMICTAIVLLVFRQFVHEQSHWSVGVLCELAYISVFPTLLAYTFWDFSMRRGNMTLIASLSYFIPLLSTVISTLYLRVHAGINLWVSCALIIAGAALCRYSIKEREPALTVNL